VHVHLQTTPGQFGEGIPMYFHDYRTHTGVVARGMPHGGRGGDVVEHAGSALAIQENRDGRAQEADTGETER
jgi:hypothetical protein